MIVGAGLTGTVGMTRLKQEAKRFGIEKIKEQERASQLAALRLMCGLDLEEALGTAAEQRSRLIQRLERLLERERLRGTRRHWSYDLNRHIALKQVLDRLRGEKTTGPFAGSLTGLLAAKKHRTRGNGVAANENGARRRHNR